MKGGAVTAPGGGVKHSPVVYTYVDVHQAGGVDNHKHLNIEIKKYFLNVSHPIKALTFFYLSEQGSTMYQDK